MRPKINLTDQEIKLFNEMRKKYHRTGNNIVESLLKMAIDAYSENCDYISLRDLGNVDKQ